MDPRGWFVPQAKHLIDLTSRSSVESRSWVTRLLLVVGTKSSRLWVRARGAAFTTWFVILLLPAVPAGFVIKYSNQTPAATFTSNLAAMVPLGAILALLTDELIVRRGGHEALLIVVTTGFVAYTSPETEGRSRLHVSMSRNFVQLVVTVVTLIKGSVILVQTSVVGTVLSNLLLMVGTGIFLGGIDRFEQHFNQDAVGSLLNELTFSIAALLVPMAFQAWADGPQSEITRQIVKLSRAASILLIVSYICYAIYSYKSHASMFTEAHQKAKQWRVTNTGADSESGIARLGLRLAASVSGTTAHTEEPTWLAPVSHNVLVLVGIVDIALLGFSTAFVCDSIDNLNQSSFILSETFIGLILLPIVGCNPHSITLARRDQMLQSFAISISGSVQLLLLVFPFTVLIGWMLGDASMILAFDGFQGGCLLISILTLRCVTAGGKSDCYDAINLWKVVLTETRLGLRASH